MAFTISPQRLFIGIVVLSASALFIWAATARVDVIVRTEGQIIPAGRSQKVQHLEGGIVKEILVHEGQMVEEGQPLVVLSDIQTRASLEQEEDKFAALRGREARLLAELNGMEKIDFPAGFNDSEVVRAETSAFEARRRQLDEEVGALKALIRQKKSEIAETAARRDNLKEELRLARQKNQVIEGLKKNNAASELEVIDSQIHVQRLKSQATEAEAALPRLQAGLAEAESRVKEAVARFRADASSEFVKVREEIERTKHGIDAGKDRLARNTVRSPVAGLVNRLNISTIGAVVRPSEVLLEITPSDQRIVIQSRLQPNDRANLHEGLPARVRIGAYDYSTYGAVEGTVTGVSADTLSDNRGRRYYRVNIEVDMKKMLSTSRIPGTLLPGMSASADISVGRRTILSYLLSPLLEFRDGAFRHH